MSHPILIENHLLTSAPSNSTLLASVCSFAPFIALLTLAPPLPILLASAPERKYVFKYEKIMGTNDYRLHYPE